MLYGCLLGICLWLIVGALIAAWGWFGLLAVFVAVLLLLPWLAPDRPLN